MNITHFGNCICYQNCILNKPNSGISDSVPLWMYNAMIGDSSLIFNIAVHMFILVVILIILFLSFRVKI